MKLFLEKTGEVESIFNQVIEKYPDEFQLISENAIFQFTTREKPTCDDDGIEIAATAQKLSNRERDLYGSDFEICVYLPYWETLSTTQKERLIYHELLHCGVYYDEETEEPLYDKDGRVQTYMEPHDLVCKTFSKEIEEFGLSESDLKLAEFFYKQYKKYLSTKEKKHNGK